MSALGAGMQIRVAMANQSMTFELDWHLANGTSQFGPYLYRYDGPRELDRVLPALTFFMASDTDARGHANLYAKLVATEVPT